MAYGTCPARRPTPGDAARLARAVALVGAALGCLLGSAHADDRRLRVEPIAPVPTVDFPDPPRVELGRALFHDPRLSKDGTVSCASCHPLDRGGMDGRARSVGVGGQLGVINAPTVFNAALQFRQFWDARALDVRSQVDGPLLDPLEMGHTWPGIIAVIEADPDYRARFAKLYPRSDEGVRPADVRDALGTFVETLLTPDAPFDRWLRGDDDALTPTQKAGYARFKSLGCIACHQGVAVGGNMLQVFGVMGDYFADRGQPTKADLGRYNVTRDEADRHRFKVPSLRNVALTAPYFHDGSATELEEAIRVMTRYQLGRPASDEDVRLIAAFLESLTGQWQGHPLGAAEAP